MSTGWECPVCGKGLAPHKDTCDHGGNMTAIPNDAGNGFVSPPTIWPLYPTETICGSCDASTDHMLHNGPHDMCAGSSLTN